jgi:hypothetical protein
MRQLPFENLMEIFVLRNVRFAQMIMSMYWFGREHNKNTFMLSTGTAPLMSWLKTINFMVDPIDNRFIVNHIENDERNWEDVTLRLCRITWDVC